MMKQIAHLLQTCPLVCNNNCIWKIVFILKIYLKFSVNKSGLINKIKPEINFDASERLTLFQLQSMGSMFTSVVQSKGCGCSILHCTSAASLQALYAVLDSTI